MALQGINLLNDTLHGELCFKWLSYKSDCMGAPGINQSRVFVTELSWQTELILCLSRCLPGSCFISIAEEEGEQRISLCALRKFVVVQGLWLG